MKIVLIVIILDLIVKLYEYIYYKKHNWERDIGYVMWKNNNERDCKDFLEEIKSIGGK